MRRLLAHPATLAVALASVAAVAVGRRVRQAQAEAALWREATREPDLR